MITSENTVQIWIWEKKDKILTNIEISPRHSGLLTVRNDILQP